MENAPREVTPQTPQTTDRYLGKPVTGCQIKRLIFCVVLMMVVSGMAIFSTATQQFMLFSADEYKLQCRFDGYCECMHLTKDTYCGAKLFFEKKITTMLRALWIIWICIWSLLYLVTIFLIVSIFFEQTGPIIARLLLVSITSTAIAVCGIIAILFVHTLKMQSVTQVESDRIILTKFEYGLGFHVAVVTIILLGINCLVLGWYVFTTLPFTRRLLPGLPQRIFMLVGLCAYSWATAVLWIALLNKNVFVYANEFERNNMEITRNMWKCYPTGNCECVNGTQDNECHSIVPKELIQAMSPKIEINDYIWVLWLFMWSLIHLSVIVGFVFFLFNILKSENIRQSLYIQATTLFVVMHISVMPHLMSFLNKHRGIKIRLNSLDRFQLSHFGPQYYFYIIGLSLALLADLCVLSYASLWNQVVHRICCCAPELNGAVVPTLAIPPAVTSQNTGATEMGNTTLQDPANCKNEKDSPSSDSNKSTPTPPQQPNRGNLLKKIKNYVRDPALAGQRQKGSYDGKSTITNTTVTRAGSREATTTTMNKSKDNNKSRDSSKSDPIFGRDGVVADLSTEGYDIFGDARKSRDTEPGKEKMRRRGSEESRKPTKKSDSLETEMKKRSKEKQCADRDKSKETERSEESGRPLPRLRGSTESRKRYTKK